MRIWVSDGDRRLQEGNGYGQISAVVSRGLIELGHEVRFQQYPEMDVGLFICPPGRIKFGRAPLSVAITMHELDHLPAEKSDWPQILNRLDLVITPTTWNQEMWEREGVRAPIAVVPLGIDPEMYFPLTGRRCTFLCVHENLGGETSRENWLDTLRAYNAAFTHEDDVLLQIKTWKWKPERFQAAYSGVLADLGLDESTAPAVEVIEETLDHERLRGLYQCAWLFLKNANREGWSMPCTEAIACGTPVAATMIQPLTAHLPQSTRWFDAGDTAALEKLLRSEYTRFNSHLRQCHRNSADAMTRLVELALRELVEHRTVVAPSSITA